MDAPTPAGRPYRSKIKRPCDRCRTRKTACILPESGPCKTCYRAGNPCTFELRATARHRRPGTRYQARRTPDSCRMEEVPMRDQAPNNSGHSHSAPPNQAADRYHSVPDRWRTEFENDQPGAHAGSAEYQRSDVDVSMPPLGLQSHLGLSQQLRFVGNNNGAPTVQRIRSLDQIDGSTAQLFGMSSESDPWLLRHCRYDEYGMRSLHRTHVRHVGGVPVEGLVPVHFLVMEDDILASAKEATRFRPGGPDMARNELDAMVAPEHGRRLVSL